MGHFQSLSLRCSNWIPINLTVSCMAHRLVWTQEHCHHLGKVVKYKVGVNISWKLWTFQPVLEVICWCDVFFSRWLFQEIDGQALLLLTLPAAQEHLDLKLGPAIKLCHHIERVKIAFYEQFAKWYRLHWYNLIMYSFMLEACGSSGGTASDAS